MAPEPDDRYASARALADDVERWIADEPVSAWREPFPRRARRWARRNRTAVTGASVALVAGLVGLVAVLAVQTKARADLAESLREMLANAALADANAALADANTELAGSRADVQARYDLAVDAIKTFHTGVSEDFLLKEDRFRSLRDRLLKSAGDFYGQLVASLGNKSDLGSRTALSRANFELADLTGKIGRPEDALAAHRKVLAARQELSKDPGATGAETVEVARSLLAIGKLLEATGRTTEALAAYEQARSAVAAMTEAPRRRPAALAAKRAPDRRPVRPQ